MAEAVERHYLTLVHYRKSHDLRLGGLGGQRNSAWFAAAGKGGN